MHPSESQILYPGIPCGFALDIFGNPPSESTSEERLTADPSFHELGEAHAFSIRCPQIGKLWPQSARTDKHIEQLCTFFLSCVHFVMCLIEMMTCTIGKAECQEKAALEKCPANQTVHLIQQIHMLCSNKEFLIGLKESCQDYYRRVNLTHSNSTPRKVQYSREGRDYNLYFEVFFFSGLTE